MIERLFDLIIILFEVCIVLLLFDGIMWILGQMFSFKISFKKLLLGFVTVFGFLWLRDHIKRGGKKDNEETSETPSYEDKIKIVEAKEQEV